MNQGIGPAALTQPHTARGIQRPAKTSSGEEPTFGGALEASVAKEGKQSPAGKDATDVTKPGDTSESEKDAESSHSDKRETGNAFMAWTMTRAGHLTVRLAGHETQGEKTPQADAEGKQSASPTADKDAKMVARAGEESKTEKGIFPEVETDKGSNVEKFQARASAPAAQGPNTAERKAEAQALESKRNAGKTIPNVGADPVTDSGRESGPTRTDGSKIAAPANGKVGQPQAAAPDRDPSSGGERGQGGSDTRPGPARASADARPHEAATATGAKMNVVSVQSTPAPAVPAHSGSQTGATLVETLDADPGWKSAAREAAAQTGNAARPEVMHTMKIQLHPANLGTVTAKLRIVGDQLAVELHTDSADARNRLSTDSDSMAKALRALGYDVDRVTVHQAPNAHNANAGTQTGGGARQQSFQTPSGNADTDRGGAGHGKGSDHERQDRQQQPGRGHGQPDSSGGGLYI